MSIIQDILNSKGSEVLTISGSASVRDAIGTMSEANVGAIVIQDGDIPAGIFTERDYLRKISLQGRSSVDTVISDVMSSPLITVEPSTATRDAMETMTERRCRHLVVTESAKMVGIVSLGDLVKHMLQEKEAEVEQLSSYISGNY
ncbi:MAG: CBS domain-containing protein [Xanthomonadales bacterium]|nr:CBS domain-containing protein [Gammaproteobacteria bacterium]MBT8054292.1 CBS domain-containing protein [Gammaproteobacteria bacterium]NND57515.1 CBS domain-containing protein [Xanthomonadales bacterium]NNK51239.1 CBS domain-containing protein [Xanthomonadales bacterium]